jgi:S1-C subfamily serine protease
LRSFSATASASTNGETIYADVTLLPGDSGGPLFNSSHHVVGVISGGWYWWNRGIVTAAGNSIPTTWPARTVKIGAFQIPVSEISGNDNDKKSE